MRRSFALLTLGLVASTLVDTVHGVFVVKASNVTTPSDILGEHQSLERAWTVYSTAELQSVTFQGSGDVFIEFDVELKTDPSPPLAVASTEDPHHPVKPHPPHRPSPPHPPSEPLTFLPSIDFSVSEGSLDSENETKSVAPSNQTPLQAVAKIVVSGDNEDLLNSFHVVVSTNSEDSGLQLAISGGGASKKGGYALPQLFVVKKSSLSSVKAIASGDVVIGENVLINDNINATVKLVGVGSGDIYVATNETLSVRALEVVTAGSGDVQLQFGAVNISSSISFSGVASGDIALLADRVAAKSIKNTILGSADLFIQADSVKAANLNTFVGGSGSVTVSKEGACVNQTITIAGSGDVATGSIACENVDVSIFGSGDVVVRANNSLTATIMASGRVQYVNATPKYVTIKGTPFHKHLERRVTQAETNKFHVYKPRQVPSRSPKYYQKQPKHHRFNWWGWFGDDDDSDDNNDSDDSHDSNDSNDSKDDSADHSTHQPKGHLRIVISDGSTEKEIEIEVGKAGDEEKPSLMSLAASSSSSLSASRGPSAASVVVVFGGVVAAVGVAAYKVKQRRARQQYAPLA